MLLPAAATHEIPGVSGFLLNAMHAFKIRGNYWTGDCEANRCVQGVLDYNQSYTSAKVDRLNAMFVHYLFCMDGKS